MRVHIARPEFKFSCAHMTVFPDGRKERLHGHNYTLAVVVDLGTRETMLEFAALKAAMAAECLALRERLLLPGRSPHLELATARPVAGELEFRLCGKRYVVPDEDALILPIDNVTVEALAAYLAGRLRSALGDVLALAAAFEVAVEESPGQGARVTLVL
jgi:6-pyruvoyltetrahydropterin/6-carboxytetrahydropterin synthase